MTTSLYGAEAATLFFGENARHVPAWMYIQDQGNGMVSFVGSSRVAGGVHPLRYGSTRTHQLIVGEALIRPHLVIATDALRGDGLSVLVASGHNFDRMLSNGETLIDIGRTAR